MPNIFKHYTTLQFYPANLQYSSCEYIHVVSIRVENCVDFDQMASSGQLIWIYSVFRKW